MKLVLAIVSNDDSKIVISELIRASFSATKLSSSGGFLNMGNTTLMIGVEDERLDELIELIGKYCHKREQPLTAIPMPGGSFSMSSPIALTIGGATIFVLDVDDFEKI